MAGRTARWVAYGVLSLFPLVAASGIRYYYAGRVPTLGDALGSGDGLLVVASWCATALLDVVVARSARGFWAAVGALLLLSVSTVAYGCLQADSVTGRVQTRGQARAVAVLSIGALAMAAGISVTAVRATGVGGPR